MADPQILGGRYQLEAVIGDGGMARVFRARDTRLSRTVAIKVLRDQFSTEPQFVERFMQEARLAAGLTHPSIIGVYDVGSDANLHYIVMEYIDGDNLRQLIAKEAPMPADAVMPIIRQLAEALDYAHGHGIVHRDIKPENILLTDKGEVKVGDFGIARALATTGLTSTGTVLGSVSYFSPEQASGYPATPESDLYAVGIILYEMLTRQLPFGGDTPVAVAMAQVNDPPPPLRMFRPDLPPALEGVVLKAMAKNPPVRYHSGHDLITALEQALQLGSQRLGRRAAAAAMAPTMINPVVAAQAQRPQKPPRGNGGALAALLTTAALLIAAVLVARGLTSGDQAASTVTPTATQGLSVPATATTSSAIGPAAATPTPQVAAPSATAPSGQVVIALSSTPASQPANTATVAAAATPSPRTIFATNTPLISAETSPLAPPQAATSTAQATPTAVSSGPLSVNLVTALAVGPHFQPLNPTSVFPASSKAIYAFAILHNKPKGVAVHFVWHYPNGKTFAYDNPYVAAFSDTTGYAELIPAGPGDYAVTVSVGGHVLTTATFTVLPSAAGSTPAKSTATP